MLLKLLALMQCLDRCERKIRQVAESRNADLRGQRGNVVEADVSGSWRLDGVEVSANTCKGWCQCREIVEGQKHSHIPCAGGDQKRPGSRT